MKILHINESKGRGGAGIAAERLAQSLESVNISSGFMTSAVTSYHDDAECHSPALTFWDHQLYRITRRLGLNYINILSTKNIVEKRCFRDADILNIHNIHSNLGYLNYLYLPEVTKNKPAAITVHDMWWFTGHCSYTYDCNKWKTGCGKCPYPDTYPSVDRDATRIEHYLKKHYFNKSNIVFVCPSKWMHRCVKESMHANKVSYHIPYGLDTEIFKPHENQKSASSKIKLLCVSANFEDVRKGFDLLDKALQNLGEKIKEKCELLIMGSKENKLYDRTGIPVKDFGYINSEREKAEIYSMADIFLFPTRADNLPLVLQESMSCGTPMISFDVGGVSDLVRDGETGLLAGQNNVQQFSQNIEKLVEDEELRRYMAGNCRKIAIEEYSLELQGLRYKKLYEDLIHQGG